MRGIFPAREQGGTKKGRSIMETANSLRVKGLERKWLGQNITIEALNYWLELLDLVQDSPALNRSVRKEVFRDLGTALYHNGYPESEIPKEEKKVLAELRKFWASSNPSKQIIFEVLRFIPHGCRAALETNFDPNTNNKIEKLLKILENIAPEEKVV